MKTQTIFFIELIVILKISYAAASDLDLSGILKFLQQSKSNNVVKTVESQSNRHGSLDGFDIEQDIDQPSENSHNKHENADGNGLSITDLLNPRVSVENDDRYDSLDNLEKILSQSYNIKKKNRSVKQKERKLNPNRLVGSDNAVDLDDYSKILIVLNPSANQDKYSDSLNRVDDLLGAFTSANKGLSGAKDLFARRAGMSNERYAGSIEDKPKRQRVRYDQGNRGGGGGGSSRTAVPYVGRNRGESIYEKDK